MPSLMMDLRDLLPTHQAKSYVKRGVETIERIYFHHSGANSLGDDVYAFATRCANYHVKPHGPNMEEWPGIGYQLVVSSTASIGLCWLLDVASYHVSGRNQISVGICIDGDLRDTPITDDVMHSMEIAARWVIQATRDARESAGLSPRRLRVMGHLEDETANTSCPGHYGMLAVLSLRDKLSKEGLCLPY